MLVVADVKIILGTPVGSWRIKYLDKIANIVTVKLSKKTGEEQTLELSEMELLASEVPIVELLLKKLSEKTNALWT